MADARDLKSLDHYDCEGSTPSGPSSFQGLNAIRAHSIIGSAAVLYTVSPRLGRDRGSSPLRRIQKE